MFLYPLLVLVLASLSCAQDFSIPSGWRRPKFDTSVQERRTLVQSLIDSLIPRYRDFSNSSLELSFTQHADLLTAIATFDRINGNKANEAFVNSSLHSVGNYDIPWVRLHIIATHSAASIIWTMNSLSWGLAAMSAYRTYGDPLHLSLARDLWDGTVFYVIRPSDMDDGGLSHFGSFGSVDGKLYRPCEGNSLAGAVLTAKTGALPVADLISVGQFLSLSAQLLEETGDEQYDRIATDVTQFVKAFLERNMDLSEYLLTDCRSGFTTSPISSGVGLAIEGLSVYAHATLTPTSKELISNQLQTMILNAIDTFRGTDGIFLQAMVEREPTTNHYLDYAGGFLVRGLYDAWSKIDPKEEFAKLIEGFIAVQFNALQDFARSPNTNRYSPSWRGPALEEVLPFGQLEALSVLNAALGLATAQNSMSNATTSSTAGPSPTQTSGNEDGVGASTDSLSRGALAGIIAGSVVGGMILIFMILYLVWRQSRRARIRRPAKAETTEIFPDDDPSTIEAANITGSSPPSRTYQPLLSNSGTVPGLIRSPTPSSLAPTGVSEKGRPPVVLSWNSPYVRNWEDIDNGEVSRPTRPLSADESIPELVEKLHKAMSRPPRYEAATSDAGSPNP